MIASGNPVHLTGENHELLTATDAEIYDAVAYADPLILRGLLHQLTGDDDIVDLETGNLMGNVINKCLVNEEQIASVRAEAAAFLKSHRDSGARQSP